MKLHNTGLYIRKVGVRGMGIPWFRRRASAVNRGTLSMSAVSTKSWSLASCKSWALRPQYSSIGGMISASTSVCKIDTLLFVWRNCAFICCTWNDETPFLNIISYCNFDNWLFVVYCYCYTIWLFSNFFCFLFMASSLLNSLIFIFMFFSTLIRCATICVDWVHINRSIMLQHSNKTIIKVKMGKRLKIRVESIFDLSTWHIQCFLLRRRSLIPSTALSCQSHFSPQTHMESSCLHSLLIMEHHDEPESKGGKNK